MAKTKNLRLSYDELEVKCAMAESQVDYYLQNQEASRKREEFLRIELVRVQVALEKVESDLTREMLVRDEREELYLQRELVLQNEIQRLGQDNDRLSHQKKRKWDQLFSLLSKEDNFDEDDDDEGGDEGGDEEVIDSGVPSVGEDLPTEYYSVSEENPLIPPAFKRVLHNSTERMKPNFWYYTRHVLGANLGFRFARVISRLQPHGDVNAKGILLGRRPHTKMWIIRYNP